MPAQLRYLIRFLSLHVLVVTQWMPLRPTADRFDGCFCLGSGPVLVCLGAVLLLPCFRWRNANLAGGFAGRRFLCGCVFRCFF